MLFAFSKRLSIQSVSIRLSHQKKLYCQIDRQCTDVSVTFHALFFSLQIIENVNMIIKQLEMTKTLFVYVH